ncbi:MAG: type III-B CRISPR module-associated protein Cmr3 [Anaerolineae bacterium]|nr:type III-B CRISPR module-associated protein Cmr3 [Anaerolineae bacterium]
MTYWYFIEPCDVWMFRDSKPFAAGQSFVARSQFPPTPQTMQGVVRTSYLEAQNVDWQAFGRGEIETLVGTSASLSDEFNLTGPLVAKMVEDKTHKIAARPFIPAPLDLVRSKSDEAAGLALLSPVAAEGSFLTSTPFGGWRPLAAPRHLDDLEYAGGWLDDAGVKAYVQGQTPAQTMKSDELFALEERVGLAMDHGRRTHRDQHLYHAQFVRPQSGVGLLVGLSGQYLPDDAIINIGGESRSGYCKAVPAILPQGPTSDRLKVVLLTPAWFSGGWQPEGGDWSRWVGAGQLVSTAIGRPQPISGWDVARNRAKPLYQYVPAGSVYYFDNADWQGKPFTESPADSLDHARIGFGGALTASWTPAT